MMMMMMMMMIKVMTTNDENNEEHDDRVIFDFSTYPCHVYKRKTESSCCAFYNIPHVDC